MIDTNDYLLTPINKQYRCFNGTRILINLEKNRHNVGIHMPSQKALVPSKPTDPHAFSESPGALQTYIKESPTFSNHHVPWIQRDTNVMFA